MEANEKTLTLFTTRIRQLILQFNETKKENADLYVMVDERDARIKELEARLSQAENDYNSLKMAKMIEISDGDLEGAQKRLAKLIRDVNKCIAILSDEQ
jgi:archaellum component FlaC